jgi:hypothetical protein
MAGFVYIMSNPDHVKLKIGMSDRDPEKYRVKELSNTSVAEDYVVEYWALVADERDIEQKVHRYFHHQRPNKDREFFTCSIGEAITAIQDISGDTLRDEQNNYAALKEYERQKEDEMRKRLEEERRQKEEEERQQRIEEKRLQKLRQEKLMEEQREQFRLQEEERVRKREALLSRIGELVNEYGLRCENLWVETIHGVANNQIAEFKNSVWKVGISEQKVEKIEKRIGEAESLTSEAISSGTPTNPELSIMYNDFIDGIPIDTDLSDERIAEYLQEINNSIETRECAVPPNVKQSVVIFEGKVRKKLKRFF